MDQLKIPQERVACLIGKGGITKRYIQKKTKCSLKIMEDGDVFINGESLDSYICSSIVKAIGRGFNPNIAIKLLKEDHALVVVNIVEFAGKSKDDLIRVRSRVIGQQGKARRMLEKLTGVDIIVYGKTVSLVGEINDLDIAKQAVENLVRGSTHGNVYRFVQRRKEQNSY